MISAPTQSYLSKIAHFVIAIGFSCSINAQEEFHFSQFSYSIDNSNSASFGYKESDAGPGIGPKSITLANKVAYVVDDYHHNIKRIDLASGKMTASARVSGRTYPWPVDVVVCHEKLLVSDAFDSVFLFDSNLVRTGAVYVEGRFNNYFVRDDNDRLYLQYLLSDSVVPISCMGIVGCCKQHTKGFPPVLAHGRPYSIVKDSASSSIRTKYFEVSLGAKVGDIYHVRDYLDCINVDYDPTGLIFFDIRQGVVIFSYFERVHP